MWSPLPAWPAMILGAKVTSRPCLYATSRTAHLAREIWSAASSMGTGRNSISCWTISVSPAMMLPTSAWPYLMVPPISLITCMASRRTRPHLENGWDSW